MKIYINFKAVAFSTFNIISMEAFVCERIISILRHEFAQSIHCFGCWIKESENIKIFCYSGIRCSEHERSTTTNHNFSTSMIGELDGKMSAQNLLRCSIL